MTTRREIVKAGAGLAAILAAGKAPAALVRSLVAARNAMTAGGGAEFPYDSKVEYITSGFSGRTFVRLVGFPGYSGTAVSGGDVVQLKLIFNAVYPQVERNFIASLGTDRYFHYTEIKDSKIGGYAYNSPVAFFDYTESDLIEQTMQVSVGNYDVDFNIGGTISQIHYSETAQTISPVLIGGLTNLSGSGDYTSAKLYIRSASTFVNGIKTSDMIPVRATISGNSVGALYDRMNPLSGPLENGIFPSNTSSSFGYGNDI